MNHKIMNTELHLVRIVNDKAFGSTGTWKEEWFWEIIIANTDNEENVEGVIYYGKAQSNKPNREVPWIELKSNQPLNEMIEVCKYKMKS